MSFKLRRLSGSDVIAVFKTFGFEINSQRGSHVKLRRLTPEGKQTITIPNHSELDIGTLKAIIRQSIRYIPESELHSHFYSE